MNDRRKARARSLLDPADSMWDREVLIDGGDSWTHFNRDDLRRLRQSNRLLEQLLDRATREDLPAMSTWLVTPFSVAGEITAIGGPDPAWCRAAFMNWVEALGAEWGEHRNSGRVELSGAVKLPAPGAPHLEVGVGLRATWWDTDEDGA